MASLAIAAELSGLSKTLVENAMQGDTKEPYSLSNYNEERINKLVEDVFSKKLKVPAQPGMVRFTFIIGGGKKVREKYDPACQKNLTAALRKYNFEDDQGAALLPECAGKYKTRSTLLRRGSRFRHRPRQPWQSSTKALGRVETRSGLSMLAAPL